MAVRSWIRAEYRRRLAAEGDGARESAAPPVDIMAEVERLCGDTTRLRNDVVRDVIDLGLDEGLRRSFKLHERDGRVRGFPRRGGRSWSVGSQDFRTLACRIEPGRRGDAAQWLARRRPTDFFAKKSAHEHQAPGRGGFREILAAVGGYPASPFGPFGTVAGRLVMVADRPPGNLLGTGAFAQPLSDAMRRVLGLGHGERPDAALFLASTRQSHDGAEADRLSALSGTEPDPNYRWMSVEVPAAVDGTDQGAVEQVAAQCGAWLAALAEPPAALVLFPCGQKPRVLGLLRAVLSYGGQHAVPVFVQSMDRDLERTAYHRLPGYLGQDSVLRDLAARALVRLSFETAQLLVEAGSVDVYPLAAKAADMAESVRHAISSRDRDECLDLLALCARVLDSGGRYRLGEPGALKIVHIAAEAADRLPKGWAPQSKADTLRHLRNSLAITHADRPIAATLAALHDRGALADEYRADDPRRTISTVIRTIARGRESRPLSDGLTTKFEALLKHVTDGSPG
jgi:hypothetical protein